MSYLKNPLPFEEVVAIAKEKFGLDDTRITFAQFHYLASVASSPEVVHFLQLRAVAIANEENNLSNNERTVELFLNDLPSQLAIIASRLGAVGVMNIPQAAKDWGTIMDIIKEGSPAAREMLDKELLLGDGNESTTTH